MVNNVLSNSNIVDVRQSSKKEMTLDKWAESLFSNEQANPTVELSRFGLKSAKDVITFLHSPAGEVILGEARAEIAHQQAIQQAEQLRLQEQKTQSHRLHALLTLMYLNKKVHARKKDLQELIKQSEDAIKKASTPTTATPSLEQQAQTHKELLNSYEFAFKTINQDIKELEGQLAQLQQDKATIDEKYVAYEAKMDEAENNIEQWSLEDPATVTEKIQLAMSALDEAEKGQAAEIQQITPESSEEAMRTKPQTLMSNQLQKLIYGERLSILKGDKFYVDHQGNETQSAKDARYIFPLEQKNTLKFEDGKAYLIKAGQDWEQIKQSPTAKDEARNAFKQAKQDLQAVPVRRAVNKNKATEHKVYEEKIAQTSKLLAEKSEVAMQIQNRMTFHQAQLANLRSQMSPNSINDNIQPRPTPTLGNTSSLTSSQPTPASAVSPQFMQEMNQIRNQDNVTQKDFLRLANAAPRANRVAAVAFVIANIPRTGNIPFQTIQDMLRNMERYGADSSKNSITNIVSPTELKSVNNKSLDKKSGKLPDTKIATPSGLKSEPKSTKLDENNKPVKDTGKTTTNQNEEPKPKAHTPYRTIPKPMG